MRLLGDFRCLVVANVRGQGSDQHQRTFQMLFDSREVWFEPFCAEASEAAHRITEESYGTQNIVDDQRLENVQLKVSAGPTYPHGNIISHDLGADHRQCLALGGVDLARHD